MAIGPDGKKFRTKKALREAVAANQSVVFIDTSAFNNRGTVRAADLRESDVVVGPDAYTQRSWYANVKQGRVV